jgi:hypothetical protein
VLRDFAFVEAPDPAAHMKRNFLTLLFSLLSMHCATVLPMQTASVVSEGTWRASGQLSATAFCGVASQGIVGLSQCTEYPDGIPLPEVRANVRRGLGHQFDVGTSLQVQGQVLAPERPLQVGLSVEGKRELFRHSTASGQAHVISVGALLGGAVAGRLTLAPYAQLEWSIPALYGFQFGQFEAVGLLAFSQRFTFARIGADTATPGLPSYRFQIAAGLYRREPAGWGLQLGYLTDVQRFLTGSIQLQFGWFFDFAPSRSATP